MDSFNKQKKNPKVGTFVLIGQGFSQKSPLLKWIGLWVATGLVALVGYLFLTHRSAEKKSFPISVSKVGQQQVGPDQAQSKDGAGSAGDGDGNGKTTPPGSRLALPTVVCASQHGAHALRETWRFRRQDSRVFVDKKNTPEIITLTYAKYLNSVLDLRVVDQAPYDLVLYVNGANVGASGPAAGYLWSSRVFRPWYCGEALGLLEETKVNESLHYVQGETSINIFRRKLRT